MFNLKNGLPNNGVTSLLQDSKGYIWIGTYDGLTRYNGHSFVTFTNTINSKIFQSNRVRSLFEGNNLDIWIGTDFGVTRYNYRTGQFIKLESGVDGVQNQECIIREIMHSQDGSQIYCLTERSGVLV
ncbi:MAG: two-component regulator propeller domain-containing protein, partial [Rikenellaceae bacterium]